MDYNDTKNQDTVDYKVVALPIGTARIQGQLENFEITIYDRTGNKYVFNADGGNICSCGKDYNDNLLKYEVH